MIWPDFEASTLGQAMSVSRHCTGRAVSAATWSGIRSCRFLRFKTFEALGLPSAAESSCPRIPGKHVFLKLPRDYHAHVFPTWLALKIFTWITVSCWVMEDGALVPVQVIDPGAGLDEQRDGRNVIGHHMAGLKLRILQSLGWFGQNMVTIFVTRSRMIWKKIYLEQHHQRRQPGCVLGIHRGTGFE